MSPASDVVVGMDVRRHHDSIHFPLCFCCLWEDRVETVPFLSFRQYLLFGCFTTPFFSFFPFLSLSSMCRCSLWLVLILVELGSLLCRSVILQAYPVQNLKSLAAMRMSRLGLKLVKLNLRLRC
jgi:hypothetical protein